MGYWQINSIFRYQHGIFKGIFFLPVEEAPRAFQYNLWCQIVRFKAIHKQSNEGDIWDRLPPPAFL